MMNKPPLLTHKRVDELFDENDWGGLLDVDTRVILKAQRDDTYEKCMEWHKEQVRDIKAQYENHIEAISLNHELCIREIFRKIGNFDREGGIELLSAWQGVIINKEEWQQLKEEYGVE